MEWEKIKTHGRGLKMPLRKDMIGENNPAKRPEVKEKIKEKVKLRKRNNKGRFI